MNENELMCVIYFINKENLTLAISLFSLMISFLVYRNNKKMKQLNIQPEFILRSIFNNIHASKKVSFSLLNKGSIRITDLSAKWISNVQTIPCDIYITNYERTRRKETVERGISPVVEVRNISGGQETGYIVVKYRDVLGNKKKVYSPIIKINNAKLTNEMDVINQFLSVKQYHKLK
ncbi:hypothetical protein BEP19_14930 [Ammoniphilus oxalaticus]|uniref:Uncharacterized protein n=1 Tax=Ammoniphilus oxalaticus TaxID=66863 RepID=A0A419SD06_9BACL|nr:hypothetical protein [Ammoniphilus oxalaticus]RKD20975.1 hypothetical protein BEP19_14930 [Ammoniphilus oxalaticus]